MNSKEKFKFPSRGFAAIEDKVAEADFFLEKLSENAKFTNYTNYNFYFSAFLSSSRSITFCLQWAMSKYPDFDAWYTPHQDNLRKSKLAKYFHSLRNYNQKTGLVPVQHYGYFDSQQHKHFQDFIAPPNVKELQDIPIVEVTKACTQYLKEILEIVRACYLDYGIYVNPNTIFTENGLDNLGWSLEDLEESLGFPAGWTCFAGEDICTPSARLKILRQYGGDDNISIFFNKYLHDRLFN